MNKKRDRNKRGMGLLGKILWIIFIIILIIIAIIAITVYQAVSLVKTVQTESASISENANSLFLANGTLNCQNLKNIELSVSKIENKAASACRNPLIVLVTNKMQELEVKCKDISKLKQTFEGNMTALKNYCDNN